MLITAVPFYIGSIINVGVRAPAFISKKKITKKYLFGALKTKSKYDILNYHTKSR